MVLPPKGLGGRMVQGMHVPTQASHRSVRPASLVLPGWSLAPVSVF